MSERVDLIQSLVDAMDELNDGLQCAEHGAAMAIRHASTAVGTAKLLAERMDQWQDAPTEDGWYWCETLEPDAPPQLVQSYQPMRYVPDHAMFVVDHDAPRKWRHWTIAGWVDLKGRVCPIRRPQ